MKEILINIEAGERRVAIMHSKRLEWYFVERIAEQRIVGNVYKGKVTSVLNGMGAAFIDCGLEKNGFLYITDIIPPALGDDDEANGAHKRPSHNAKISDILKKGESVLVQASKEEIGTKGARLTTHIVLPGRYLVLMPSSERRGVSRRIRDEAERRRIKDILREIQLPKGTGLVARTAAEGNGKKEFLRDVKYLLDNYDRVKATAERVQAPSLIFEELDIASKTIRDFLYDDVTKVFVDDKDEFKRLRNFTSRIDSRLTNKIAFYRDDIPLFEKHGAEDEIDKLFERKIYLKCGGYITIEQTEGMIAIDVNSGKFTGRKNLEDTVFKVNCEAADEISRQLRLRDIGGIVIIDFIDMESRKHRNEVFSILQNAMRKDKARTNIISISELGVVEMTRQRVRRSLESVSYQNCPYCEGRGIVKSPATMVIIALRRLKAFLKTRTSGRMSIDLMVHPYVAQRLVNEDAPALNFLRKRFRRHIAVTSDDTLHVEEIKIQPAR